MIANILKIIARSELKFTDTVQSTLRYARGFEEDYTNCLVNVQIIDPRGT